MARFLVTGGAGFIGSHLCDSLIASNDEVVVLDNLSSGKLENLPNDVEFILGDVSDASVIRRAIRGADGVFHLAAVASVEKCNLAWRAAHRTNLYGTVTLFEAACDQNPDSPIPVVYASSAAVYGSNSNERTQEDVPIRPLSAYGADKFSAELHARAGGLIHGLPTAGMRFFNVYGPRQDPYSPYSGVISIFLDRVLSGQALTIYGDGKQSRDFVFVSDVIEFMRRAMAQAAVDAPVFNVCTGSQTSILDLANAASQVCGAAADLEFMAARSGDIRHSGGDPSYASHHLDFLAQVKLPAGLDRTLQSMSGAQAA